MYDSFGVLGLGGQLGDSCLYGRLQATNLLLMSLKTSVVQIGQLLVGHLKILDFGHNVGLPTAAVLRGLRLTFTLRSISHVFHHRELIVDRVPFLLLLLPSESRLGMYVARVVRHFLFNVIVNIAEDNLLAGSLILG